ncbi:MAG TPA: YbjQ family protein [Steroidobacteraceae bacterium]|nr:YbjQ family protein [Steroidobacteraceae bacterium]
MNDAMVTTALVLPGYKIVKSLGVVRGITVRSRSIVFNFFGANQTLFGGNITIYTNLCEQARSETYELMCTHARQRGANAIVAMHYDATELMAGLTEVLCYGTAVTVEPDNSDSDRTALEGT